MQEVPKDEILKGYLNDLKAWAVSGVTDPETIKNAWKKYLQIREMKAVGPIDKVNLGHARTAVEILEQGGTYEVNSTTKTASLELKADLGLVSGNGLFGELDEIQKSNVETFFTSMSEALIRKS